MVTNYCIIGRDQSTRLSSALAGARRRFSFAVSSDPSVSRCTNITNQKAAGLVVLPTFCLEGQLLALQHVQTEL